jgi:hypothetical protein
MKEDQAEGKEAFDEHLGTLRDAKRQTDEAVALLGESHNTANETLKMTWQAFFDLLSQKKIVPVTLEDFNDTAAVIYKLVQSAQQLKATERKTREYEVKLAESRAVAARVRKVVTRCEFLPPSMRKELEKELNLIG